MKREFYTLITGSSTGIGKALAIECAKNNMNILCIALPGTRLEKLSEDINRTYQVKTDYFFADLTVKGSITNIMQWIEKKNYKINMLINNAGISCEGPFEKYSADFYEHLLMLNTHASVLLTRSLTKQLLENRPSYILNLGSVASYFPMPFKAVYGSSKLFMLSFSKALKQEFKNVPLQVSVVCPGPVVTNRHTAQSALDKGIIARMMHMKAHRVARYAIKKLKKGTFIIKPGFLSKTTYYVSLIIPQFIRNILVEKVFYSR